MSDVNAEVPVVCVESPYTIEVNKAVADATLDNFGATNNGTPYFLLDGQKYLVRKVGLSFLRRFAARNGIHSSQRPHHSLSQQLIVDEIMYKIGSTTEEWTGGPLAGHQKKRIKKSPVVNLFRLANVVFSEGLREAVLARRQSLSREELDMNLKSDQKLFEKIAGEYNALDVDESDAIQFPEQILCPNFGN
jgi:hypothetical protein